MSDAADAITLGYARVFGESNTRLMCHVHVSRAVDRRKIENADLKLEIKLNFSQLRLAYNKTVFKTGCDLFLAKWRMFSPEFAVYFEKVSLGRHKSWYNGAGLKVPHTNNMLEGFNGKIKSNHTYYQRKGLAEFKIRVLDLVRKTSMEYLKDRQPYKTESVISNHMTKEALRYDNMKNFVFRRGNDEKAYCYMTAGNNSNQVTEQTRVEKK